MVAMVLVVFVVECLVQCSVNTEDTALGRVSTRSELSQVVGMQHIVVVDIVQQEAEGILHMIVVLAMGSEQLVVS